MRKRIKQPHTVLRKTVAMLLIFLMLLSPELLLVGAGADGVWDADVFAPVVYYDGAPIYNTLEVAADAELTVQYSLSADFLELVGETRVLTMPSQLIPAAQGTYDVTSVLEDESEHFVGYVEVDADLNTIIKFHDSLSFIYGIEDPETEIESYILTLRFALPCVFDPQALPEPGEMIDITSGGEVVTLVVTAAAQGIVRLDGELPPGEALTLKEVVTGFVCKVTRRVDDDYTEIAPPEMLQLGDEVKLVYNFSMTELQVKEMYDRIVLGDGSNQFFLCKIPLPGDFDDVARVPVYAGQNGPLFAELFVDTATNSVYIEFCGDIWEPVEDAHDELKSAEITLEFSLDEEWFDEMQPSVIQITETDSYFVNVPQPGEPKHTLTKTCTGYDPATRTFTWRIAFTPDKHNEITGPITFTDTFNSDVHTYVDGSLKVNGADVAPTKNVPGIIEYEYNGLFTPETPIIVTLQTQLAPGEFDRDNYGEPSVADNKVEVTGSDEHDLAPYAQTSKTVPVKDKSFITKTATDKDGNEITSPATIDGNEIYWKITINTYNLPITDLVLHDKLADGLKLDVGSLLSNYGAAALGTTDGDGCTFTVTFGNGSCGSDPITVTYKTTVDKDAFVDEDGNLVSPQFNNRAWLTYAWQTGVGIPITPVGKPEFTIENYTVTGKILSKSGTYNKEAHTITWTVTVNPRELDIRSGTITDYIRADEGQTYVLGSFRETTDPLTGKLEFGSIVGNVLTVNVTELGPNTATFEYEAELLNPEDHAVFNEKKIYHNGNTLDPEKQVHFEGEVMLPEADTTVTVTDKTTGTATHDSKILAKSGKYNKADNTVTWAITVNEDAIKMKNATLIDTIPQYQAYIAGSMSFDPVFIPAPTVSIDQNPNNGTTTLTIPLGDLEGQVVVTYKTKVDVDNDSRFKKLKSFDLTNEVELTRDGYETEVKLTGKAPVSNVPLEKKGQYIGGGEHKITYTVVINPHQLNLQGMTLEDTLPRGLQLDIHSVVLCPATYNSSGVLVPGAPVAGGYLTNRPASSPDEPSSFVIKLPASSVGKSFILTYDCLVLYSAAGNYTNSIKFSGTQITIDEKKTSIPIKAQSASGTGLFERTYRGSIALTKRDGVSKEALAGVTFHLYTTDAQGLPSKAGFGVTDSEGKLKFGNLTLGKKYWLEEEQDASGKYSVANARVDDGSRSVRLSNYSFTPTSEGWTVALIIDNYEPSPLPPPTTGETTDDPPDDTTDDPTDDTTDDPTDDETEELTEGPVEELEDAPPSQEIVTPVPGSPDYPPVPVGTILVETEDGDFIELDEDGIPLGTWHYDDEEEMWIFEPYIPLAVPQTGDAQLAPLAMAAFILSVIGAALLTLRSCFGLLKKKR